MNNLSNFLGNIKNNHINFKHYVKCPISNLKLELCNLFLTENLIRGFFIENKKILIILLKYNMNKKAFQHLLNKTEQIKFNSLKKNFKLYNGLGVEIISTINGFATTTKAVKLRLGGQKMVQLF